MKLSEFLKNNDVELTEEQEKQLKDILGIKGKWIPDNDKEYYYLNSIYNVDSVYNTQSNLDKNRIEFNNCFKTKEEAQFRASQIRIYNDLKNFADENNGEIDWNDITQYKWLIAYDYEDQTINFFSNRAIRDIGQIYFSSEDIAQKAVEKVGEDRIKKYLFGVE